MIIKDGLTFDDVLLVPKYSSIASRSNTNLSVDLGKGVKLDIPLVSANMKNVTGLTMAKVIRKLGGLPILHRFMSRDERLIMVNKVKSEMDNLVGHSVGVGIEEKKITESLVINGAKIICIDIAHGHHELCLDMIRHIHTCYPEVLLIAGNVATGEAANQLSLAGADVVKVGVGPGSICSTRIETGNGVPQMTALDDVFEMARVDRFENGKRRFKIIADGGIRRSGDIVKSLCFSDAVMIGSILAGTEEAPGSIIDINGRKVKKYEGSSTHKTSHIEGVRAMVDYKGPVEPIITNLLEGIRSGLSYQGSQNLEKLKERPEFVRVTNAGLKESHPHSVILRQ